MKNDEPIILSTSDEAARWVTVSGWVARGGQWWGADERMARWSGATHVPCKECGAPTPKSWITCEACRAKADDAKWAAREQKAWTGEPLYSLTRDRYFMDEDDLADYLDVEGCCVDALRLVICEPTYPHDLDGDDLFCDDIPEDMHLEDVAGDLADAIAKVNEVIAQMRRDAKPLSWTPGKFAATGVDQVVAAH